MVAATLLDQRLLNDARRRWHFAHARALQALVITAALAVLLWPRVEFHRGTFDASFNQDLDVDTINLKVRGGFEFRVGGGSLNLVNTRWDRGVELFRFPL